jgi:hypothetical protein
MGLVGEVDDRPMVVRRAEPVRITRSGDRRERGDAAARRDAPGRRCGIAHQVGHPADQEVLHPNRARPGEEDPRVLVADGSEEIADRRVVEPATRDIRQVGRRRRASAGTDHVPLEQLDRALERNPLLGDRSLEQARPLVLGLDVALAGRDRAEKALGGRHRRVPQPATPSRARLERTGGPLQPAELLDQVRRRRHRPAASACSLSTVFQFRPVPRLPRHRSITVTVSLDRPTPSG